MKLPSVTLTLVMLAWVGLAPLLPAPAARVDAALRSTGLNRADRERQDRGYYEQLLDAGRRLDVEGAGSAANSKQDPGAGTAASNALTLPVDDARETVLRPNHSTIHAGAQWTTNDMGLRDRPYSRQKPPGTIRLALLGDSIGSGWGVADGQGFEPRLEEALDSASRAAAGPRIEILNFAVPGHAPGQRWENFTRSGGWDLGIDAVLYEATPADVGWDVHRLRRVLTLGSGFEAPVYAPTMARLGISPGWDVETYKRLLKPYRWEVIEGVYDHVAAQCHAQGVPCVWFMIPRVDKSNDEEDRGGLVWRARAAGFDKVLDLSSIYAGLDTAQLAVAPGDYHPNAEGHARIAESLVPQLRKLNVLRLEPGPQPLLTKPGVLQEKPAP